MPNNEKSTEAMVDYLNNQFMDIAKNNQTSVSDLDKNNVYVKSYDELMNLFFNFLTKKYQKDYQAKDLMQVNINDALTHIYLPILKMQLLKMEELWMEPATIQWSFNSDNLQITIGNHPEQSSDQNSESKPDDNPNDSSNDSSDKKA